MCHMETFPSGFLVILLGVFAGAVVLTLLAHAWKQHKLQRLKDPHRDYYRR